MRLAGLDGPLRGDPERLLEARRRLLETRFFHTVELDCLTSPGPSAGALEILEGRPVLLLRVAENEIVREVVIEGQRHFFESDIRKRVFLRRGTVLDPRPEQLEEELERQAQSVRRLYSSSGFGQATVEVSAEPLKAGELRVRVRIDEGPLDRIGEIEVSLPSRAASGCPPYRAAMVRRATEFSRGDVYTPVEGRRARNRVLAMLRRQGYVGARVRVEYAALRQALEVEVAADRCYDIGFFERHNGLGAGGPEDFVRIADSELSAALPFGESDSFDIEEAELGRVGLEQLYEARGHQRVDVRLEYHDLGARPRAEAESPQASPNVLGAIHYYITLDVAAEIRGIYLFGVEAFAKDEVRGWLETRVYDFFAAGGFLQVERLLGDLQTIRERYHAAGYLQFAYACDEIRPDDFVGRGRALGVDGLTRRIGHEDGWEVVHYRHRDLCFTVLREGDAGTIYLSIAVDEGPRSALSALRVQGAEEIALFEVREALALEVEGPFSPAKVMAALNRLRRLYRGRGYHSARVEVACAPALEGALESEPIAFAESCAPEIDYGTRVEVHVRLVEGRRYEVGERFVRGTFETAPGIVLRDLPRRGAAYDEDAILAGVRRLRNLGVFDSIQVTPVGLDSPGFSPDHSPDRSPGVAGEIGLVVDVEETRTRFVDLSVGFETLNRDEERMPFFLSRTLSDAISASDQRGAGYGDRTLVRIPDLLIAFEAAFVHRNFLGRAKELHLPLRYGLSTTALNRLATFRPTYLDSRFLGTDLRFRMTPFVVYDRATRVLDQFSYGSEMEFALPLPHGLYGSLRYELSRIRVRDPRAEDEPFGPYSLQNKLNPRISWDRTDSPLNPARGFLLGMSLAYLNALRENRFDNFLKYEMSAKVFFSLRDTLVLALFARAGGSYSFDTGSLPAIERYRLGGSQGLRGFADDGVGQYEPDGSLRVRMVPDATGAPVPVAILPGGDTVVHGSAELRFPILRKIHLWGGLFFDWGALSENPRDLHWRSLRFSTGLGLRWLVGGEIPIRIDYGVIIDRRCKAYELDGSCVREDRGALHFGMLYTF